MACNARIGFEDGTTSGFAIPSEPFLNAFSGVENVPGPSLCGGKSLRLPTSFDPQVGKFAASVEYKLTEPLPRDMVVSLWLFVQAQSAFGLQAVLEAIPPSGAFNQEPIPVTPGVWQRLEAGLLRSQENVPLAAMPAQLTLRLFSPFTAFAGSVYVDEVDWK